MTAPASMPAAAVVCLLLSALAVVSAAGGVTFPAPAPAPTPPEAAVDPPHQEAVTANPPCDNIWCVQGHSHGGAHVASVACPGEGGRGVVCCCCPPGYIRGECCHPMYCTTAPSSPPIAILA